MVVIGCIGMSGERRGAASGGHVDLNAPHGIGHGRLEIAKEHRSRPHSSCFRLSLNIINCSCTMGDGHRYRHGQE